MDFRGSLETRIVGGAAKAVCRRRAREITKNVGVMRVHYTVAHGRDPARVVPPNQIHHNMSHVYGDVTHNRTLRPSYAYSRETNHHSTSRGLLVHGLQSSSHDHPLNQPVIYVKQMVECHAGVRRYQPWPSEFTPLAHAEATKFS
jgi:hypothetical protein